MDTSKPVYLADLVAASLDALRTLTTRHLVKLLRRYRPIAIAEWDVNHNTLGHYADCVIATDKLKLVLANRPHVPNKKDGKVARRLAAKRKT